MNTIFPNIPGGMNPLAAAALASAAAKYPANDFGLTGDSTSANKLNTAGFRFNASTPVTLNSHVGRFDYNLTSKQQLFVRTNIIYDLTSLAPQFPDTPAPKIWSHPWGTAIGEDLKQDLLLEWKPTDTSAKTSVTSAADFYDRKPANQTLFDQALNAIDKQHYDEAAGLLHRIVDSDPRDFQAWTQLANLDFRQKDFAAAENEYLRAIDSRPGFFLAVFNLGRLEITMKNYDVATGR